MNLVKNQLIHVSIGMFSEFVGGETTQLFSLKLLEIFDRSG